MNPNPNSEAMASFKKRRADEEDAIPKPPISYVRKDDDSSSDSDTDPESDTGKLLESLSKEQLVHLLLNAAASHPPTLAVIRRIADSDPSRRKIFVHGLGWDTSAESLRLHFSPFGDLDDVRVVVDKATGKSKGYGFILFRHRKAARKALKQPQKLIDNRMTACQLASLGPPSSNPNPTPAVGPPHDNSARKIYVGNVQSDVDGSRLLEFFKHFGEIEEGPIGFDRVTGKPKGFALFVYKTLEGARRALEEPSKNFEGHILVCNRASEGSGKSRAGPPPASKGPAPKAAAGLGNPAPNSIPNANTVANMGGGYAGLNYPAPMMTPDMAAAAAMFGQGFLGGMQQPNAAAMMAMLTAASQNPAAFNPALLASLNPAVMAAFGGAAGQQMVPASGVQSAAAVPAQGYSGLGNAAGASTGYNQTVGYQGPPGFQCPPGFQNAQNQMTGSSGAGGGYQNGGQGGTMARPSVGPMSGYGPH